jgi:hypothetical protein
MPFDFVTARFSGGAAARILEGWSPLGTASRRNAGHGATWLGFLRSLLSI